MEFYDNLEYQQKSRTQVLRITFQRGIYKGYIEQQIGGDCLGLNILEWEPECLDQDDIDDLRTNDSVLTYLENEDCYLLILKDNEGKQCCFECDTEDLRDSVVALEIVSCEV